MEKKEIVILSVTNDLSTDQRIHKVALNLIKAGFTPMLVGRKLKNSLELNDRPYQTKRFKLPFAKGMLFYASYNIRLFFYLLSLKAKVFVANDLDTLPANYLAYSLKKLFRNKKMRLVYDSHELFTEVPELNGRKLVKNVWLFFERLILPKLKNSYTVCESIADYYKDRYNLDMQIIQNLPICNGVKSQSVKLRLNLPENKKIILYQGALNIGRGIEHVIQIMDKIDMAILVIAGTGDIEQNLKELVKKEKLQEKVIFTGKIPLENLAVLTNKADIGLVLQEDISLSYKYVLPNRLFDFIKAKIPVLASDLPEIRKIVKNEQIGLLVKGFSHDALLKKIDMLLKNEGLINKMKDNIANCSAKYCWESQENKLTELYKHLL